MSHEIWKINQNSTNTMSKVLEIWEKAKIYITIFDKIWYNVSLVSNKIIDIFLSNVKQTDDEKKSKENFSYSLDEINILLNKLKNSWENFSSLNIFVWLYFDDNFYFSKIGSPSCYLIWKTISEATYEDEREETFEYISNWKIEKWNSLIISNKRVLDYITKADISEIFEKDDSIKDISNSLLYELEKETSWDEIDVIVIKKEEFIDEVFEEENKFNKICNKIKESSVIKKIENITFKIKKKIDSREDLVKNWVFISGILVSFVLLYFLISSAATITSNNNKIIAENKEKLNNAVIFRDIANQNMNNPTAFNVNIEKAEKLAIEVKEKSLFTNDTNEILETIDALKKQFNWVESFNEWNESLFSWDLSDLVKTLIINKKVYIVRKNKVEGPVINWKVSKVWDFSSFNQEIIEAVEDNNSIVFLTKKGEIFKYFMDNSFKKLETQSWESFEKSNLIRVYNQHIYLVNSDRNQIYRYRNLWNNLYGNKKSYLIDSDKEKYSLNNKINTIDIDGWIYVVSDNLVMKKLFAYPEYKLKNIVLNKLPNNYNLQENSKNVKIIARNNLSYIYLFFNNKIWIFEPNSRRYQDVSALTYVGQIEWSKSQIKDVYIKHDNNNNWEALAITDNWIFKLNFEINPEEWIIIR